MSILPTKDGLYRKSEIAQLDLDIPDNLIANDDQYQWNSYAKSISPIKLVSKFNEAADQFIALVKHEDDLLALPQSKKELIYSKWLALSILNNTVSERFDYAKPAALTDSFNSDIQETMYVLAEFLQATQSPMLSDFKKRQEEYDKIDRTKLLPFLNAM